MVLVISRHYWADLSYVRHHEGQCHQSPGWLKLQRWPHLLDLAGFLFMARWAWQLRNRAVADANGRIAVRGAVESATGFATASH